MRLNDPLMPFDLPEGKFYCLTQGLASSGKTTWAKYQMLMLNDMTTERAVLVCRDDIREGIRAVEGGRLYDVRREKRVAKERDRQIDEALNRGLSVIVADTNLYNKTVEEHRRRAAKHPWYTFCINDTFIKNVSVEECIKRDQGRPGMVGKDVIERQYYDWWEQQPKPENKGHTPTILCDLDGTLALIPKGANPYDRDFTKDGVNIAVRDLLRASYRNSHRIVFLSGRDEKYREQTELWLSGEEVWFQGGYDLIMRPAGDRRKDTVVKKEMYLGEIYPSDMRVQFVIDDRPSVVRMWRAELGLTCFQVGPNLEF